MYLLQRELGVACAIPIGVAIGMFNKLVSDMVY